MVSRTPRFLPLKWKHGFPLKTPLQKTLKQVPLVFPRVLAPGGRQALYFPSATVVRCPAAHAVCWDYPVPLLLASPQMLAVDT